MKNLVLVGCVVAIGLAHVGACHETPQAPTKPFGVPSTAAWANGVWIDCWRVSDVLKAADGKAHPDDDAHFECSIYDERGAIQKKARFTLNPATDPRRVMQYASYDGVRIHLDDGRVLE